MSLGRVYILKPCRQAPTGGHARITTVALRHLDPFRSVDLQLSGDYTEVANVGQINEPGDAHESVVVHAIGNAQADVNGNFLFEPGIGGGRLDKLIIAEIPMRIRYIEASHFGEVNAYYHVTRIAAYVDRLLRLMNEKPLPRVRVLVNAHHAATREKDGGRDGVMGKKSGRWLPFQGGHYRLPTRRSPQLAERFAIWRTGEIHLGPGWRLTHEGLLPELAKRAYRCNASHNPGIIYHEYGHHMVRHTADFRANAFKAPHRQSNRKTANDEGLSDYWAAAILGTPHIWCWHRRHDTRWIHPRSLASRVTMADFDKQSTADPHRNGTILAAALWDLRQAIESREGRSLKADLLVLSAMLNVGRLRDHPFHPSVEQTRRIRDGFSVFMACLLHADSVRFDGRYGQFIRSCLEERGIYPCKETRRRLKSHIVPSFFSSLNEDQSTRIYSRSPDAIIPPDEDILHPEDLADHFLRSGQAPYAIAAVGDVMLGARARKLIRTNGKDYPFSWVAPIFQRASIVLGNLEGPFARKAEKKLRNHSYKVDPKDARSLRRAGFSVMNLANNHLLDCGRDGVHETLEALSRQGIMAIGAGENETVAHGPAIFRVRKMRLGILGYYWNRRTSARGNLPGSARDRPPLVKRDIKQLCRLADRVVVTVHWGIPYERYPLPEDCAKARYFIDCGADMVIGHHPHVIQPVEIYRGRAIFYSVGNFAFGSGNSRSESLLLGIRFQENVTEIDMFAVHARNRDPRVNYQPKIMGGTAARQTIERLKSISGASGDRIEFNGLFGSISLNSIEKISE